MAGHARERRPGVYELRAYAGRDPISGRKRYETKTVRASGKREAQRLADAFALEVHGDGPRARASFGDLLERWFETCSGEWAPGTALETRRRIDRTLAPLHDRPVDRLTTADLNAFYAELRRAGGRKGQGLAASTVVRLHSDVLRALEHAIDLGWRSDNPAERARPGKVETVEVDPPDPEDVIRLLEAAGDELPELLVYLALDAETGARRAELAALRISDLGADEVTISRALTVGLDTPENRRRYAGHIWPSEVSRGARRTALIEKPTPKNRNSVRTVALAPTTVELVRGQVRRLDELALAGGGRYPRDGFLFPARPEGDRPLRPDVWTHRFGALREDLDLERVRLHDLRHFVATNLLTSGVDLATVAGVLGHGGGGKTTLAIYAHAVKRKSREASDVMAGILSKSSSSGPRDPGGADVIELRRRAR